METSNTPVTLRQASADAALKQYSRLVRRIACQLKRKLPANIEFDDLIQVGMIGLHTAIGRFHGAQGVQFEIFATAHIRGAMSDELRREDYLSRGMREEKRHIDSAVRKAGQRVGHAPRESDVAREMGITLSEYQTRLNRASNTQLVHLEDLSGDEGDLDFLERHAADEAANPAVRFQDQRMRQALVDGIQLLSERERFVMSMYYEHDMSLREIGTALGVTESRVSQIHTRSIAKLRVKLESH